MFFVFGKPCFPSELGEPSLTSGCDLLGCACLPRDRLDLRDLEAAASRPRDTSKPEMQFSAFLSQLMYQGMEADSRDFISAGGGFFESSVLIWEGVARILVLSRGRF